MQKTSDASSVMESISDFLRLDIRVGSIIQCQQHPDSQALYCQKIDLAGQVRQVVSGLSKHVPLDQMKGLVLIIVNLKPRKLVGLMSSGMLLLNSNANRTVIKLLAPKGSPGQRVILQGFQQESTQDKQPILSPKDHIFEKCIDKFMIDTEGIVSWSGKKRHNLGIRLKTSCGYIIAPIPDGLVI